MYLFYLTVVIKAIILLTIFNVWIFRFNKATPYRGGNAKSMKEEFEVYGIFESEANHMSDTRSEILKRFLSKFDVKKAPLLFSSP